MTTASSGGTSLIIAVLALGISSVSAIGSIAAVLVARANLHRQIQVATREAWMREFREQVAAFLAWRFELHRVARAAERTTSDVDDQLRQNRARLDAELSQIEHSPPSPDTTKRLTDLRLTVSDLTARLRKLVDTTHFDLDKRLREVSEKLNLADQMLRLLIAERGWQDQDFLQRLQDAVEAMGVKYDDGEAVKHSNAVHQAAAEILRRERAALEAPGMMERALRSRLGAVGGRPWSRFVAWCRRDPPRFP